jgi:hypothetical protein
VWVFKYRDHGSNPCRWQQSYVSAGLACIKGAREHTLDVQPPLLRLSLSVYQTTVVSRRLPFAVSKACRCSSARVIARCCLHSLLEHGARQPGATQ